MTPDSVKELRDKGYCVVIFSPKEMDGVDEDGLSSWMISKGWDYIDMNGDSVEEEEDSSFWSRTD